uniref:Uncharacterized protein n=1 Tax=Picea sitchensis TaxID=3332 RepID=A0A6B9XQ30_PICSI|nr:hypothetical protein Q903MT_gene4163 [Picea sitchensis]
MFFLLSRDRIRESVENEHFILPFFDPLTCKSLVKEKLPRSKTSIVPARETLSRTEQLGIDQSNSFFEAMAQSTKEFVLSIYLLTQHGILTLKEVPSNGLFVYIGLHAAGKVSDAPSFFRFSYLGTRASATVDVFECEPINRVLLRAIISIQFPASSFIPGSLKSLWV